MKSNKLKTSLTIALAALSLLILLIAINYTYNEIEAGDNSLVNYQVKKWHSRDGIGKFYYGREIALVMGHQELLWLERPSRSIEEQPEKAILALNLKPSDVVADLGAGSGYFSFPLAQQVPQGKVLAVDIQPQMLEYINFIKKEEHVTNIETIQGKVDDPQLEPNTIDLALMVDAYHELEYPKEIMLKLKKALKPNGRVALIEYRLENPLIPIKTLHKMSQKQVKKEMTAVGLEFVETLDILPQQHLMIFKKAG